MGANDTLGYIVGVDAGGTKTLAVAYGAAGETLAEHTAGPGNVTAGGDAAKANICDAVEGALRRAAEGDPRAGACRFVGVGLAGFDPVTTPGEMVALLEGRFGVPAAAVDDGSMALYAAFGEGDGIVVIAGTGAIAYGRRDGAVMRRGGWGHMLGDRGSGWAVAADALRLALADADDGRPESPLARALLAEAGKARLRELIELTYAAPKAELARLSRAVSRMAGQGDETARGVLACAGRELAELAAGLAARLGGWGAQAPSVRCAGGLLERDAHVHAAFAARLQELLPGAPIQGGPGEPPLEPARGALALWRMQNRNSQA